MVCTLHCLLLTSEMNSNFTQGQLDLYIGVSLERKNELLVEAGPGRIDCSHKITFNRTELNSFLKRFWSNSTVARDVSE